MAKDLKVLTLGDKAPAPIRDIPLMGNLFESELKVAKKGDIYVDIRGGALLGVLYGLCVWREIKKVQEVVVTKSNATFFGGSEIASAIAVLRVMSKREFRRMVDDERFGNMFIMEVK
jgi:hypothetical protein